MNNNLINPILVGARCCYTNGFKHIISDLKRQQQIKSSFPLNYLKSVGRNFGSWPKIRPIRIRVITMDITGTLVSFRGSLNEHYVGSAEKCGVELPESIPINKAFAQAYKECSRMYPCFGNTEMTAKEWWKICVVRSFLLAGVDMTEHQQEVVFQRIYSLFGSQACYEIFQDALPFLHWAHRKNVICGLLSNADERYGDSILPMLGITHDQVKFQCFSKDYGYEKPDTRFYTKAMERSEHELLSSLTFNNNNNNQQQYNDRQQQSVLDLKNDPLLPSQILHVGNDYTKDFEGARRSGWHAVLLDRYNETELASEWRRRGAVVLTDLMDLCEFLGSSHCKLG